MTVESTGDALAQLKRRLGSSLAEHRVAAGLTQGQLAATIAYDRTTVAHAERGRQVPAVEFWRACDNALGAAGHLVGQYGNWLSAKEREAQLRRATERRDRGPSGGIAGSDGARDDVRVEPWELLDTVTHSSISSMALDELEAAVARSAERYPVESAASLEPTVHRQLARVAEALADPQRVAVRQRLVRMLGYLCGLAASLEADSRDLHGAAGFYRAALQAAQESDDDDLAAWVLANQAIAIHFSERRTQSRALLDSAAHYASSRSNTRRQAWVAALQARACAASGERTRTMQLLDESETLLGSTQDPVGGADFFDAARLDGLRGASMLILGDAAAAEAALAAASKRRSTVEVKGRALLSLDLAQCHVLRGEHDGALDMVLEGLELASEAIVQPIATRATELVGAMEASGGKRHADTARERLAELTRNPPTRHP